MRSEGYTLLHEEKFFGFYLSLEIINLRVSKIITKNLYEMTGNYC